MWTQTSFIEPRRRLRDMPDEIQPLYRLSQVGPEALSSVELLALALGGREALDLAETLLLRLGSIHQLTRTNEAELQQIAGIGQAQSARLMAVVELGRRLQMPLLEDRPRISSPSEAAALLMPKMRDLVQEELWVVLLDTRNRVAKMQVIYKGNLNTSIVRIAEIFRPAIAHAAAAIILAHNHPSGDPSPSPEDIRVTREIVQAGKLFDIPLLDHLIIGQNAYNSLKERGLGFDVS
jgi:DNA repair protein RadC